MTRLVSPDRRVQRTLDALRGALLALMVEKDWDDISVQDICDRANIGRSTFYTHFDDKDALLIAGFEDLRRELRAQRSTRDPRDKLAWARGLIEHAYEQRELFRALLGKRSGHLVQKRFRRIVADLAKQELTGRGNVPLDAVAHYVSGAFFELLTWWLDARSSLSPDEIEDLFRRMTAPALAAV